MDATARPFTAVEFDVRELQRLSTNVHLDVPSFDLSHYTGVQFKADKDEHRGNANGVIIQLTKTLPR
jgi:hypothetical protein